ncbi:MAG: peptidoglycan editing factor PgeF [Anaerolineales bacterium]|jgi:hypothetical protein|nr:peptidoglycan editing factor PgeF [Anaerolineales bacterium]
MSFHERQGLRYYSFDTLDGQPLVQAIFTRLGGHSLAPWASLNMGGTVGDNPEHVQANRRKAFEVLDLDSQAMFDVWQVHSAEVVLATRPRPPAEIHHRADAILTDRPGLALMMRFADCVPIVLFDPIHKALGIVHAGWVGTVNQVAARAVEAMRQAFHTHPADLLAGIGPSIGVHHYEVGPEVVARVQGAFGADSPGLLVPLDARQAGSPGTERVQFDLWQANRLILERSGVHQVEIAGLCTACHLDDWFSHRGELGKTGRFGALVALKE